LRRHNTRIAVTLAAIIVLAGAGFLAFREMDFSFVRGLSVRSLAYVVPLFIVYQSAAVQAHALLMRDWGHRVSAGRLTVGLFAGYWRQVAAGTPAGADVCPAGASATSVLYFVELALTIAIAVLGLRYFLPNTASGSVISIALAVIVIVAFSILFHLSSRQERRFQGVGRRLTCFLSDLHDGMRRTTTATFAALVGLVLTKRAVIACTSYLILKDLGSYLPLKEVLFLQSSAILVGFVTMIPLGFGTRDVTSFLLYTRLGLRPEVSVAIATFERLAWTLVPLCLGIAATAVSAVFRKLYRGSIT